MAKLPLPSHISILKWIEENICSNCAFYRTNCCAPKIEKNWQDAVSSINDDIYYSANCFKVCVKNSFKELDKALSLDEDKENI